MVKGLGVIAAVWLLGAAPASAQRRDGGGGNKAELEIALEQSTRFENSTLSPGRYRLSLDGTTLTLHRAQSMVMVARVPLEESALAKAVPKASARVLVKGKKVQIRVQVRDRAYLARGQVATGARAAGPRVDLASRKTTIGITGGIPEKKTEGELIAHSLARYEKDVKHCAAQAHKQRWDTDHPRFRRCVCPLTSKWRLPKVEKNKRVHRVLAKGRSGYSITVTDAGKVADCRVWTGSKPPADENAKDTEAQKATR